MKKLGVLIAGLLLALGLAEGVFRLTPESFDAKLPELRAAQAFLAHGRAEFEANPHMVYRHTRTPERLKKTGRTQDRRYTPHPEGRRILCLGGSTTESGNSLGQVGSYPFYLEKTLAQETGLDYEVLQAGHAGWTSAESLVGWMLDFKDFEPDLVLIHHAVNDLGPMTAPGFLPDYTHWRKSVDLFERNLFDKVFARVSLLYVHLRVERGDLDLVGSSTRQPAPDAKPVAFEVAQESFVRNVRSIGDDVARSGGRVGLVTMPMHPDADSMAPGIAAGVRKNNQALRLLAHEKGWYVLDLEHGFPLRYPEEQRKENFLDLVHVSPLGNLAKAQLITRELVRLGWADK